MAEQAEAGEVGLDPGVLGVGSDGERQAGSAGFIDEGDHAGERGEQFEAALFGFLAFGFEGGVGGGGAKGGPRIEGVVGVTDGAEKARLIKGHAVGGVHVGVGADEGRLGVENETVEIENERANHGDALRNTRNTRKQTSEKEMPAKGREKTRNKGRTKGGQGLRPVGRPSMLWRLCRSR